MNIDQRIANELNTKSWQVEKARTLIEDGKTLPFIARYRKEMTGVLDETQLRNLADRLNFYNRLQERKTEILKSIEGQAKLTPELKNSIETSLKLRELEDFYLPYKKKKKTRADMAIEKGLKDAAQHIKTASKKDENFLNSFLNPEKEVNSIDDVIKGAEDIIAQEISENVHLRNRLRDIINKESFFTSKKTKNEDENSVYQDYYEYREKFKYIKHHNILALNRGSKQKILKFSLDFDESPLADILNFLKYTKAKPYFDELSKAVNDSLSRLLLPSLFNEVFSELLDKAEQRAVDVFAENLRNLLLQNPLKKQRILGIDPGFRTGCKLVSISEYGDVLSHNVIYQNPPQNKIEEAEKILTDSIEKYKLSLIVIGNGTASRETQQFIVNFIQKKKLDIKYAIVSESGASVYSASKVSVEELPQYDVTTRGAISIARRVQDPLAELVKIPPESIGVGMYQHDISSALLKKTLEQEVESVVNFVGVNLNTASKYVLKYISGLNSKSAGNIVQYRQDNGAFKTRKELLKVANLGPKAYEQAAGFCRIPDSQNPLDRTTIHPENYNTAQKLLDLYHCDINNFKDSVKKDKFNYSDTSEKLKCSEILLNDLVDSFFNQNYDPRDEMPQIELKDNILSIEDLKIDMILQGTVTNVVDFGAFIDIGIKNSGLLHKSNIANEFVKNPGDYVKVGEIVKVKIISIDKERGRLGLSMNDL